MRDLRRICLLLLCLGGALVASADDVVRVTVVDPFVELHSGPGRGYPVLEVVERGGELDILQRRADWFQVRTLRDRDGWVPRAQLERTLLPAGAVFRARDVTTEDLHAHRYELGALAGEQDGTALLGLHGAWRYTRNLSAQVAVQQAVGRLADTLLVDVTLAQHPFPDWRLSPWVAAGVGMVETRPASTLVASTVSDDEALVVAAGIDAWLSQSFVLRAEYRHHVVLANSNGFGEADSWAAGLLVFF